MTINKGENQMTLPANTKIAFDKMEPHSKTKPLTKQNKRAIP